MPGATHRHRRPHRPAPALAAVGTALVALLSGAIPGAHGAGPGADRHAAGAQGADRPNDSRTWFVSAAATARADGSRQAPFASLRAVASASRPGDRIVVLPAPRTAGPLDGGIRLMRRQRLIGAGPPVRGRQTRERAPLLTNTTGRLNGDAIRLASGAVVRNVEVIGPRRGGIYGRDVTGVTIAGNDVSGHNTACTPGFHIPPFSVPTTVPGVGIPISDGLHNGWAGIMVDATRGARTIDVRGNHVHHAECGDGIDVRAWGHANVQAAITGNDVRELRQGGTFESMLAIGLQTRDRARLVARVADNRQAALGNDEDLGVGPEGADSEGVFINPSGPSRMRVAVVRNTYRHKPGRGGFSANGLEFVAMGDGPRASVRVLDSRFAGTPGDVLEQLALGTNARLRMRVDDVVATRSTGHGATGVGDTFLIPGNNADCLLAASGGAGNVVDLVVRRSRLTDCANNGLTFGSAVANGTGPTSLLRLDVAQATIAGNHDGNLRVGNLSGLERLSVRVERTDLSDGRGVGSSIANFSAEDLGTTGRHVIDLGGGALGSRGGNCLDGGALAAALVGYDVTAQGNWWGTPDGPGPGRTIAAGGTLDHARPLAAAPAHC